MSDAAVEFEWTEDYVLDAFRVTGFFSSTPKPNVGRRFNRVLDHLRQSSPAKGITAEEVVEGLTGLAERKLLRIEPETATAYLTDKGYAAICQAGFKDRQRAALPDAARVERKGDDSAHAATVFAIAFATLTGQS